MRFFAAILFFLIPFFAISQKTLLETSIKSKKNVHYALSPDEDEKISNFFLEHFTENNDFKNLAFSLEYVETVKLSVENGKTFISYRLSDFAFSGNNKIRNIDVSKLLLPSSVFAQVALYGENNTQLLNVKLDTCCLTNPNDIHEWLIPIASGDSSKVMIAKSIKVVAAKLVYKQSDMERFKEYLQRIDEYYNTDKILTEIVDVLGKIKTDNIDMMPLYQIDIINIQKSIEKIENQKFFTLLDVAINDPINFKSRFKLAKEQYASVSAIVNHTMNSIDEVYFNKGYSFFLKNNYDKAAEYYERSIRANPAYVRSHYRLAEVYFIKGDIDKSAEIILHALKNLKVDKDIEVNVIALAQQIMLEYIERGESKIRNEDFRQALKEFEKADAFCKSATVIECMPVIYSDIEKAKLGLYKSYLTIAVKAIENDKIELAAKFIYDAKQYLIENGNPSFNHKETDTIIEKVINKLVEKGHIQYNNKDYEAAVNTYNKAMDLCKLCDDKQCNTLLESEIKNAKTRLYENILIIIREHIEKGDLVHAEFLLNEASKFQKENKVTSVALYETENLWMLLNKLKYKGFIAKGLALIRADSATEALQYFLKAKTIEKDNIAFPDSLLNSYIQNTGKPSVMAALSNAKLKAWANDIAGAKKLEEAIFPDISLYLLIKDSLVMTTYNDLITRIKEQECTNMNFEIDRNYFSAKRYIDNAEYIFAYDVLSQSVEKIKFNGKCMLDPQKTLSLYREIKDLYIYQFNKKLITDAYFNLEFEKADSILAFSESLFDSNPIIKTKLLKYDHDYFFNNIYNCNNIKLLAAYYLRNEAYAYSLNLLLCAKDKNCSSTDFTEFQKDLSQKLAAKDFKADKKIIINTSFKNYKVENDWYSAFRKSYKWKIYKMKFLRMK